MVVAGLLASGACCASCRGRHDRFRQRRRREHRARPAANLTGSRARVTGGSSARWTCSSIRSHGTGRRSSSGSSPSPSSSCSHARASGPSASSSRSSPDRARGVVHLRLGPRRAGRDVADIPTACRSCLPSFESVLSLIVPALSLALIGLVQGAGVAAAVPNRDGKPADVPATSSGRAPATSCPACSRGCPSADRCRRRRSSRPPAPNPARTVHRRWSDGGLVVAASGIVGLVAMPALAALLIVIGGSKRSSRPACAR